MSEGRQKGKERKEKKGGEAGKERGRETEEFLSIVTPKGNTKEAISHTVKQKGEKGLFALKGFHLQRTREGNQPHWAFAPSLHCLVSLLPVRKDADGMQCLWETAEVRALL